MKKIKIICDWNEEYQSVMQGVNTKDLTRSNWWYLHGELESKCGFDCATIYTTLKEFPKELKKPTLYWNEIRNGISKETESIFYDELYLNGIFPVNVYGVHEECVAYFWTSPIYKCTNIDSKGNKAEYNRWDQRGLVCLKSDKEACEYALQCMQARKEHI